MQAATDLEAARFERAFDLRWRRASYTSITAAAHYDASSGENVVSEPESPGIADEPSGPGGPGSTAVGRGEDASTTDGRGISPLDGVPGGPQVGTFVHALLEGVDFAAPDSPPKWTRLSGRKRPGADVAGDLTVLGDGLVAAITTPLGPLLPGAALRDIACQDRLNEVGFELPLAGGDVPVGQVSTADIASLLAEHLSPNGPLAGYPERLLDPLLATSLRGYLTGSLDLVFRRSAGNDNDRWYVADYKTNWLGDDDGPLTAWHYRPAALDAEMQRRHYPLQAMLDLVALHRYLRWRLPGYSPDVNLGGVLYLFLRGMIGPETPVNDSQPCGVFSWAPSPDLIIGLSDLFGRGRRN